MTNTQEHTQWEGGEAPLEHQLLGTGLWSQKRLSPLSPQQLPIVFHLCNFNFRLKKMSKSSQICKQMCWWKWLQEHFTILVQLERELTKVMPSHSSFTEPPWVGSQEHSVLSYWAAAAFLRSFPEIPQEPLNLVLFPHTKLKQQLPSAELLKKVQESRPELVRITPSHIPCKSFKGILFISV